MSWWMIYDGSMMMVSPKEAKWIAHELRVRNCSVREAFDVVVPKDEHQARWKFA